MQSVLNEYISLERSGSAFIEKYATTFRTIANMGHIRDAQAWFSFFDRWCRREVGWQNLRQSRTNWHNSMHVAHKRLVRWNVIQRKLDRLLRRIYFERFISRGTTYICRVFMHLYKSVCDELYDVTVVLLRQGRWM